MMSLSELGIQTGAAYAGRSPFGVNEALSDLFRLLVSLHVWGFLVLLRDMYGESADRISLQDCFHYIYFDRLAEDDFKWSLVIARAAVAEVGRNFWGA
jgi:hypothetical protein